MKTTGKMVDAFEEVIKIMDQLKGTLLNTTTEEIELALPIIKKVQDEVNEEQHDSVIINICNINLFNVLFLMYVLIKNIF